jgi:mitochondrial fission protein ELM1
LRRNKRFEKFFELFKSLNIIKNLENSLVEWNYEKLNETDRVSRYIKEKIKDYDFS